MASDRSVSNAAKKAPEPVGEVLFNDPTKGKGVTVKGGKNHVLFYLLFTLLVLKKLLFFELVRLGRKGAHLLGQG